MMHARLALGFLALAALLGGCTKEVERPTPLHVVLIVVDTLRADHLSTYGYRRPTSPELDKLAAQGVVFERAVSQGSWTSPSMVSMMTGAYIADELIKVPAEQPTLAQSFQKEGYATGAFIYNNMLSVESGFHAGFDLFEFEDPPYGPIDKIAAWFQANRGRPSFTFIHLNEAHDPYDPPSEYDRFVKESDSLPEERLAYYREAAAKMGLKDYDRTVRQINEEIGGYDDDVRYSDEHIGKILAALRAGGEWDKTAVVIAADHGEGLWTRPAYMTGSRLTAKKKGDPPTLLNTMHMTHGSQVNAELVHVPLIMVAPGMPQGVRAEPWVENVDIAPTLLELCDLPVPVGMQGQSLLALWSEPEELKHQKRGVFSHTRYVSSFIDQNGYQLILPTPLGECEFGLQPELYHLRTDPEARVNLAEREPARVKALTAEIQKRMGVGLKEIVQEISDETMERLNAIGYPEAGVIDTLGAQLRGKNVDQLLADLSNPKIVNCLVRVQIGRALAERELTPEQRAKLQALRQAEQVPAIQKIYDQALAGK